MNENYNFIGIDEGNQTLLMAQTSPREILWKRDLGSYSTARALQLLNGGRLLVGFENGYFEADIRNGEILHSCNRWENVTSAARCKNGNTLITGLDLEGRSGVCVLTLSSNDEVVSVESRPGDYVRLMSSCPDGTLLLSTNDHICETAPDLSLIRKLSAPGFLHAWQAVRLLDGSTLVSAGYGAFMARFSADGRLHSTFGAAGQVPEEVSPAFYACFDFDSQGNILVANWQGHGPDNGKKGTQLLCFSPDGHYLAGWSYPEDISSLQGILLLK